MIFYFIGEVQKRFKSNIPLLDPIKDLRIAEKEFKNIIAKIDIFEKRKREHGLHDNPELSKSLKIYGKKDALLKELEEAKNELKKAKSLLQMQDLKCMKRVLRRLGYCSTSDVIEVKGRIACELSSADELLLTEVNFTFDKKNRQNFLYIFFVFFFITFSFSFFFFFFFFCSISLFSPALIFKIFKISSLFSCLQSQ